jgi:hypothetical protein
MTGTTSRPAVLRGLVTAVAAAVAIGAGGLSYTAIATAEPGTWDIEGTEACEGRMSPDKDTDVEYLEALIYCCEAYGGVWSHKSAECTAPPARPEGASHTSQLPRPLRTVSSDAPLVAVDPGAPSRVAP